MAKVNRSKAYKRGYGMGKGIVNRNMMRYGSDRGYAVNLKAYNTVSKRTEGRDRSKRLCRDKLEMYEGMLDAMSYKLTGDKTTYRERRERAMRNEYPSDFFDD